MVNRELPIGKAPPPILISPQCKSSPPRSDRRQGRARPDETPGVSRGNDAAHRVSRPAPAFVALCPLHDNPRGQCVALVAFASSGVSPNIPSRCTPRPRCGSSPHRHRLSNPTATAIVQFPAAGSVPSISCCPVLVHPTGLILLHMTCAPREHRRIYEPPRANPCATPSRSNWLDIRKIVVASRVVQSAPRGERCISESGIDRYVS
jgi:hypothetical protein